MNRKRNTRKSLKKQKYNIILFIFVLVVGIFLISFLTSLIRNRKIAKYDKEIVVLKDNGSEIDSISLRELRKGKTTDVNLPLSNQDKKTSIEGVSLEKIINSLKLDTTKYTNLETVNKNGIKSSITIDKALEPDRVYLVYKINSQAVFDYNNDFGHFIIVDTQSRDSSDWMLDVNEINLK